MRQLSPVDIIVRAASSVPDAKPKPGSAAKGGGRKAKAKPQRSAAETAPRMTSMRRRMLMRVGRWSLASLLVLGLAAAGYHQLRDFKPRILVAGISHALGLRVAEITIEGRGRTAPDDLAAALAVYRGSPALLIDLEAMRARIEALPWVRSAAVARRFPDRIHVEVEERHAVARWAGGGVMHLIDADGTPFAPRDTGDFADLPLIEGQGARAAAASLAAMLAETPSLAARVESARRMGDRRWDIRFDGGLVLRLPDRGADDAWRRFATMFAERNLLAGDVLAVDLRFPDRVVLRMREPLVPRPEGEST